MDLKQPKIDLKNQSRIATCKIEDKKYNKGVLKENLSYLILIRNST